MAKWVVSKDEENYCGHFLSRETAILGGPETLGIYPGREFWVGEAVPAALPDLAELLEGALESWAGDEAPDGLGDDFPAVTPEARDELSALLDAWADKHGVKPSWFLVEGEERHVAPGVPESAGQ